MRRELHRFHLLLKLLPEADGKGAAGGEVVEFVGVVGEVIDLRPLGAVGIDDELGGFRADRVAGGGVAELLLVVGEERGAPVGRLVAEREFLEADPLHLRVGG